MANASNDVDQEWPPKKTGALDIVDVIMPNYVPDTGMPSDELEHVDGDPDHLVTFDITHFTVFSVTSGEFEEEGEGPGGEGGMVCAARSSAPLEGAGTNGDWILFTVLSAALWRFRRPRDSVRAQARRWS